MIIIGRLLAALVGIASLATGGAHWFLLDKTLADRGMQALDSVGRANARADIGGIFMAIGVFALLAAWKRDRRWALAALLTVAVSLTGRLFSLAIDGRGANVITPMAIEVVTIVNLAIAAWAFGRKAPEGL